MLAYVTHMKAVFIEDPEFVYLMQSGVSRFIDIEDIQELVGIVRTRNINFVVKSGSYTWQDNLCQRCVGGEGKGEIKGAVGNNNGPGGWREVGNELRKQPTPWGGRKGGKSS